jgi:carbonic anhydrase
MTQCSAPVARPSVVRRFPGWAPTSPGPAAIAALWLAVLLMPPTAWGSEPAHAPAAESKLPKPTDPAAAPATASATAPATAPAEPLEQLRQRLAERLQATRSSVNSGPYDIRVSGKGEPGAKPTSLHSGGHGGAATSAKPQDKAAGTHAAHWDYQGPAGPAAWGGLKPEFSLCASGQRQSPIDIRGGLAVDLDPVRFEYQTSRFGVVDNGHTVQVNLAAGNTIEVGGRRFELVQFHFHRPSEERIDGKQFELSLHLVHKDEQGRLAVVALLFEKGPAHPVLQHVWNNLPLERNEEASARVPLELLELLPPDRRYYTYMGSLTTPPCSEGVQWIVMRQALTVAPEQIAIFARIYPMNARPVQQASGRRIMQSF